MKKLVLLVFIALLGYLLLWPVPVEPVSWQAPQDKGFVHPYSVNQALADIQTFDIPDDYGPEDLAIRSDGVIFVSMHSGWLLSFTPKTGKFAQWVNTGGRPLGIEFTDADELIVADAYLGLLSISTSGDISLLADEADGMPIRYADDLDIAEDGMIYFSDASTKFGAKENAGTLAASLLDLMEHGGHGRLLAYNPSTKQVSTLLTGLNFANGVAVSHDQQSVLVNETGTYRVLKYWLQGDQAGKTEVVIDNLPGFPDNLARGKNGSYWLGLVSPRSAPLDNLSAYPFLRKIVQRLPAFMRPQAQFYGHIIQLDQQGKLVTSLQDPSGTYPMTTGALETEEFIYVSSLVANQLARKAKPLFK